MVDKCVFSREQPLIQPSTILFSSCILPTTITDETPTKQRAENELALGDYLTAQQGQIRVASKNFSVDCLEDGSCDSCKVVGECEMCSPIEQKSLTYCRETGFKIPIQCDSDSTAVLKSWT
eukprot:Sdes_comp20974_c0_seq3m19068